MLLNDTGLTFDDITLVPRYSDIKSRKDPDLLTYLGEMELQIPIVSSPMNTVTESKMCETMGLLGGEAVLHRYMPVNTQCQQFQKVKFCHGYKPYVAIGASGDYLRRAESLYSSGARKFCIDIANGHSQACLDAVEVIYKTFHSRSKIIIMAGNVCTYNGAKRLVDAGADVVRVGCGCGSACSTRLVTGFGIPQFTAIQWCSKIKEEHPSVGIVADGGLRTSGDMVKALVAGADALMIGGLIAGTSQSPGRIERDNDGRLFKFFHGMASNEGREDYYHNPPDTYVAEGISMKVPFKGCAKKIINDLINGIKTGLTYAGANNLKQLCYKAQWIKITDNGRKEANPNLKLRI